jgi:hypothetical protein
VAQGTEVGVGQGGAEDGGGQQGSEGQTCDRFHQEHSFTLLRDTGKIARWRSGWVRLLEQLALLVRNATSGGRVTEAHIFATCKVVFFGTLRLAIRSSCGIVHCNPLVTKRGLLMKTNVFCGGLLAIVAFSATSAEEIGIEEKVKSAYELYLQDQSVTLQPQQWQVGIGISYTHDERFIGFVHEEQRTLQGSASLSYGVSDRLELFGSVPVVFSGQQATDFTGDGFGASDTYLGDVTLGLNTTLISGAGKPNVTLQSAVTLPTSTSDLPSSTKVSLGVTAYQDFDPAFVYGGVNVGHSFGDTDETDFGYRVGLGFSLNYRLAVGAEIQGGYRPESDFGSGETTSLTGRATFALSKNDTIQPSVSFGLTDSSPDVTLGLQWSRRF